MTDSDWNICEYVLKGVRCTRKTRAKTGKYCHACAQRRCRDGDSARASLVGTGWNRCQVTPGCQNFTEYRRGTQCRNCRNKKQWAKDVEENRARWRDQYWANPEKFREKRKAYYKANKEREIKAVQLYRLRKELRE